LGQSEATKFIIPIEFTNLIQPLLRHTQNTAQNGAAES
jgi:hypothetical protein